MTRRELIVLLRRDDSDPNQIKRIELVDIGAEVISTEQDDDALSNVDVGRGNVLARIAYTPRIAAIEDDIDEADFRGKRWQVVSSNRNNHRMTLELTRGGQ